MMFAPLFPTPLAVLRLLRVAAICALSLIPAAVLAGDVKTTFRQTIGIERTAELSEREGLMHSDLEVTPYTLSEIATVQKLASGAQLRFGAGLLLTSFPETTSPNEIEAGFKADYRQSFGAGNAWQYRLTAEVDTLREEGDWTFNRVRLGGRLGFRHDKGHTTFTRIRFGYRDQNEETFEGYDQSEYLAELGHVWRPWGDKRTISGTVFAEVRRADESRFSYNEVGLRLAARIPVNDRTKFVGKFSTYQRDYFADAAGLVREDQRIRTTFGIAHSISSRMQTEVFAGWDNNASTFSDRAYSGAIAGIKVAFTWD